MFRYVLVAMLAPAFAASPPPDSPGGTRAPASQPASQPEVRTRPRTPPQARILEELLRGTEQRANKPILPNSRQPKDDGEPGVAEGGRKVFMDGTPIWDKPGRLVMLGERSEFHFAPQSEEDLVAPVVMEFNKNALLEAMEAEGEAGVEDFRISAEVTRYRGRNYLILRKYRRHASQGNLGP